MTRQRSRPTLPGIAVLATAVWLLPALVAVSCVALGPPPQSPAQPPAAAAKGSPSVPLPPAANRDSSVPATLGPDSAIAAPLVEDRRVSTPPATPPVISAKLESALAQLFEAYRTDDRARLATFAGQANLDVEHGAVRVILEMDRSPEAHPAGPAATEIVTTAGGTQSVVEHAPPIAIRADLAAAIVATGATYETAYQDWVQVLAPFASLPALADLPDVRVVRLPIPAGH